MTSERTKRDWIAGIDGGWAATLLVALGALAYSMIAPLMLMDGDTGWHLAAGRWILAHATVPTVDPFSYTARGRPWTAHEWLCEIAMYLAWRAGGWSGLIALTGVAFAAMLTVVGLHLRRWLTGPGTPAALVLVALVLTPALIARPHILVSPLLATWIVVLLRARERGRAPSLGWAALMLLWANAHASFIFGLALTAVFALDALVEATPDQRGRVIRQWAIFGLSCGLVSIATPSGFHGLTYPLYVGRLALLPYITEWHPTDFGQLAPFEIVLLAGLFVLLSRPVRIPPVRLLLLLGSLHLALEHMRQVPVFIILATLVLAEPIARARKRIRAPRPLVPTPANRAVAAVALLAAIAIIGARVAMPVTRADTGGVPASAIRALPPALRHQRVFNEYSFGGALILAGIPVFIDGRSDMYGDTFSIDYFEAALGDRQRWRAADARWRFGWTILPPANPLVEMLDADPRWRRIYADKVAVIHVRR